MYILRAKWGHAYNKCFVGWLFGKMLGCSKSVLSCNWRSPSVYYCGADLFLSLREQESSIMIWTVDHRDRRSWVFLKKIEIKTCLNKLKLSILKSICSDDWNRRLLFPWKQKQICSLVIEQDVQSYSSDCLMCCTTGKFSNYGV